MRMRAASVDRRVAAFVVQDFGYGVGMFAALWIPVSSVSNGLNQLSVLSDQLAGFFTNARLRIWIAARSFWSLRTIPSTLNVIPWS